MVIKLEKSILNLLSESESLQPNGLKQRPKCPNPGKVVYIGQFNQKW